jgi:hypothetical protein
MVPASSWNALEAVKVTSPGAVGRVVGLKRPTIVLGPFPGIKEVALIVSVRVVPGSAAWSASEAEPTVAVTGLVKSSARPVPVTNWRESVPKVRSGPKVV